MGDSTKRYERRQRPQGTGLIAETGGAFALQLDSAAGLQIGGRHGVGRALGASAQHRHRFSYKRPHFRRSDREKLRGNPSRAPSGTWKGKNKKSVVFEETIFTPAFAAVPMFSPFVPGLEGVKFDDTATTGTAKLWPACGPLRISAQTTAPLYWCRAATNGLLTERPCAARWYTRRCPPARCCYGWAERYTVRGQTPHRTGATG